MRPQGATFLAVVVALWWGVTPVRDIAVRCGAFALFVGLLLAPWVARNWIVMGDVVLLSTNIGDNLCIGHGPNAHGAFRFGKDCDVPIAKHWADARSEMLRDREKRRLTWEYIWRDPGRQARLAWNRLYYTLWIDWDGLVAVQSYGADMWIPGGVFGWLRGLFNGWYL